MVTISLCVLAAAVLAGSPLPRSRSWSQRDCSQAHVVRPIVLQAGGAMAVQRRGDPLLGEHPPFGIPVYVRDHCARQPVSLRCRRRRRRPKAGPSRGRSTRPEGAMRSRALSTRHQELAPLKQPVGAKGLPQSKRVHAPNALTCTFAPLAGLEPAAYGLEVDPQPSMPCCQIASSVLRYGRPSRRCGPVAVRSTWENDQRNDRRGPGTMVIQLTRGRMDRIPQGTFFVRAGCPVPAGGMPVRRPARRPAR